MTCDLSKNALIRNMVRKLRFLTPDCDEDTVLGTILTTEDGDGKFISSAEIWKSSVIHTVWRRDVRKNEKCHIIIFANWPKDDSWLDKTSEELAAVVLP